jgi:selenocysteine lyase/cysteine desulfurase
LRDRFGDRVEVLIDACQFRIAPATLAAYLAQGFLVAITGSKFLGGPTFSGALLVPPQAAERLSARLPHPGLRAYSARAEWPPAWVAAAALTEQTN